MSTFNVPKPKLGDVTAFTIATTDLDRSLAYYSKLGFSEVFRSDFPFPLVMISDGMIQIMLRKGEAPYLALTYYVKNMDELVKELESAGIVFAEKPKAGDPVRRHLIQTPDGLTISLVAFMEGFTQPPGPTMLQLSQEDYFNPEKYVNKACGLYGEFAQPVKDLDASIAFWEKLGFVVLSKTEGANPWSIISDGLSIVGLHQTTDFTQPTITYFAVGMKEKIEKLESEGLTDFKEVMGKGNVVLDTPEGQKINLFSF
jgi:catechol 2,3-dioxygenase-like lactoylglutathione lyase family enzyme